MKITVGVPNYDGVKTETMMSIIPNLFMAFIDFKYKLGFELVCPAGCHIHKNRMKCAQDALETGSDYLFFVDTDVVFPDNALVKLLNLDKDIVGATYNKRSLPLTPILNTKKEDMPTHPFQINAIPTGLMLIRTEVFRVMKAPWFALEFKEGEHDFVGSDIYFCKKARECGFEVWCDPTIDVKHIGDYKF